MIKLKEFIMSFTYKRKKEKVFEEYKKIRNNYKNMDLLRLDFEYAELKSEYEHKKNVIGIFTIAVSLAFIAGVWSKFFEFMKMIFSYSTANGQINGGVIKVSFIISVTIAIVTTLIILYIIYRNGKEIRKLREKIIIIEQLKSSERDKE